MRMNFLKIALAGMVVWLLVITTFTVLPYVAIVKESMTLQSLVVVSLMPLYSSIGSWIYYRRTGSNHGVWVGVCASLTALLMDVMITVPFFEIPNGGSYGQFFSSPVLWLLVFINIATFYAYGYIHGKRSVASA